MNPSDKIKKYLTNKTQEKKYQEYISKLNAEYIIGDTAKAKIFAIKKLKTKTIEDYVEYAKQIKIRDESQEKVANLYKLLGWNN